ncbi:MAG: TetR/AcrR family transcriptional regulator, partial [Beijerinckiaceae bacterium]
IRRTIEAHLRRSIELGVERGEMPASSDADALAGHIMAAIQGLSTLARDGATREKLLRVASAAMAGWPHGSA